MLNLREIALDVPNDIREALAAVQTVDPQAVVAGGCLRDLYFKQSPKDIDVFVGPVETLNIPGWVFNNHVAPELMKEYAAHFGPAVKHVWNGFKDDGPVDEDFGFILNGGPPVQVISRGAPRTPDELLADFDFGFNQIVFDGLTVRASDAFRFDAARNTATFVSRRDKPDMRIIYDRAYRLKEKFPGRQFLLPI